MDFGNVSPWTSTGMDSERIDVAGRPESCFTAKTYSPFGVCRISSFSTGTPWDAAKPIAALVARPPESNATAREGPIASLTAGAWRLESDSTTRTRRRGVPKVRTALNVNRCSFRERSADSARDAKAGGMNCQGSSSVPISTTRDADAELRVRRCRTERGLRIPVMNAIRLVHYALGPDRPSSPARSLQ